MQNNQNTPKPFEKLIEKPIEKPIGRPFEKVTKEAKVNLAKDSNRNWSIMILGILAVALLWVYASKHEAPKETSQLLEEGCLLGEEFNTITGEPCAGAEEKALTPLVSAGTTSYDTELEKYIGKRLLLDANCESTPKEINTTTGGYFLIANNSKEALKVSVPGRSVTLAPYHYMLNSFKTKGEFSLTCDGDDVATINVEE